MYKVDQFIIITFPFLCLIIIQYHRLILQVYATNRRGAPKPIKNAAARSAKGQKGDKINKINANMAKNPLSFRMCIFCAFSSDANSDADNDTDTRGGVAVTGM